MIDLETGEIRPYAIPIERRHLRAVALFAALQDIRYYLCGVLVHVLDDGSVRLIATDGSAIAITHTPTDDLLPPTPCRLIVPIDVVKIFAAHKGKTDISISSRAGEYRMECIGLSVNFTPIDGRFPEYEKVVPATVSGETAQFDPVLLMRFSNAAKVYNKEFRDLHIEYNGDGGARVRLSSEEFLGICMPWRGGAARGLPAWITPAAAVANDGDGLPGIETREEAGAPDVPLATAGEPQKRQRRAAVETTSTH